MARRTAFMVLCALAPSVVVTAAACHKKDGDDGTKADPTCLNTRDHFATKVWPFMSQNCTGCHAPGGIATTGENPKRIVARYVLQWDAYPGFIDKNLASLQAMVREYRQPKLLLKPTGHDHVGGKIFDEGSETYKNFEILYNRLLSEDQDTCSGSVASSLPPVELLDWSATFRKAAIDLGGRLPNDGEVGIADEGSFDKAFDALMKEPTFSLRMKELWNDVLLFRGSQVGAFSFDKKDYARADEWQKGYNECISASDPEKCRRDFISYWDPVTKALREEPLELIARVIQKEAPFSEILTAPYSLVNPQTAIIYGLTGVFAGATDPGDWRELTVKTTSGVEVTGAGVLSTPGFLARWVSTRTNINRARARVVYKSFLATDVLKLAQRPVDASALTAVKDPTKNASACAVCHAVLDPVANSFSNFSDDSRFYFNPGVTAATDPHTGTFAAGFGYETTPGPENKLLPWMTAKLVKDERFPFAVARAFYVGVIGLQPLRYPRDPNDPKFLDQYVAWNAQDKFLRDISKDFAANGMNAKRLVRAVVKSAYYRGVSGKGSDDVLADVGNGRLLTPEMFDRKILAVMGTHWGGWSSPTTRESNLLRRYDSYNILFGGIDSSSVTERATQLNAVMSGVVERMANDMACKTVGWELTKPKAERLLLPEVEVASVPATDEAAIRKNIVHLFQRILGEKIDANGEEANAAYKLFADTHAELTKTAKPDALVYGCRGIWDRNKAEVKPCGKPGDPDYRPECYYGEVQLPDAQRINNDKYFTIGSWMAVVSYLLTDYRFTHQ